MITVKIHKEKLILTIELSSSGKKKKRFKKKE